MSTALYRATACSLIAATHASKIGASFSTASLERMILVSAEYRLHQGEFDWFAANERSGWHQLDGEICLHFSDAEALFISWQSEPVVYSIGCSDSSFFEGAALQSVEMSAHDWWRSLIGHEVQLTFARPDHQSLCISAGGRKLFLSSQYDDGMFQGDCVRVSPVESSEAPTSAAMRSS